MFMGRKSKDVTACENDSPPRCLKKSAGSLPKILETAEVIGSLQPQHVRCGKANCKCARGELHDGLYYFFWSTPTGVCKRYVRRADVPAVRAVIERRKSRDTLFRRQTRQAEAFLRQLLASVRVQI